MITNVTQAAAPTNVVNSEQKQLVYFGVGSASQTSQTFTVDQQPFYLSAYNLGSDDVITVQQVFGKGSGTEVASFAPVNGAVTLNQNRTKVRIDHPGRYQLLHTGSSALGTFTVAGGAAVMTGDPIGDLSTALYQIFTTLGNSSSITVAAPITISGAGSVASPYIIGFQAGTIIGSSAVSVTGNGTAGIPYVVSIMDLNKSSGVGNILNTADAGKIPALFTDGSLHTSFLGWEYKDLGTVTSGPLNIDWSTSRAQKVVSNLGGGLLDIDIYNILPASPGYLRLMFTQSGTGNDSLQFTGAGTPLANAQGVIQPSSAANISTVYLMYYDGTKIWLEDFTSTDTYGVGRFGGGFGDYIGGDNIVRPITHIYTAFYATAAGTNTYTATLVPAITAYVTGNVYTLLFTNANTTAATLNLNSLGAKAIQRRGVPVTAGQIPALSTLQLLYDGTNLQILGAA